LAGLQLKGLQVNQGSTYRWQAAVLAEDIADRIRADKAGATAGSYAVTGGVTSSSATGERSRQSRSGWRAWRRCRRNGLDCGYAGGPANSMTITVTWVDSRAKAGVADSSAGARAPTF